MSMRGYLRTALGVAVVGTIGVNYLQYLAQRNLKEEEYCKASVDLARNEIRCVQLLGGAPIKVKKINLKKVERNPTEVKMEIPVSGNTRRGIIYTMSTRRDEQSKWNLQYAVFSVKQKTDQWTVWLYPKIDSLEEIPEAARDLPVQSP
uniref:uncharacterized protein LOC120344151 n=1 Tax=Styela clava TaxID=7725 RepID=UPI001939D5AF|nr:uncharacterized protein LOC120344151 [Styela clava]